MSRLALSKRKPFLGIHITLALLTSKFNSCCPTNDCPFTVRYPAVVRAVISTFQCVLNKYRPIPSHVYVLIPHSIDFLAVVIPSDGGVWGLDTQKGETARYDCVILRLAKNHWFSGTTC